MLGSVNMMKGFQPSAFGRPPVERRNMWRQIGLSPFSFKYDMLKRFPTFNSRKSCHAGISVFYPQVAMLSGQA